MSDPSPYLADTEAGQRALDEAKPPGRARAIHRGDTIGRYLVVDRLGAGGMGVVYAAFDPDLDRKVAVKLLHRHQRGEGGAAEQRLLREAQAMAQLDHPNVVTVHDVGTVDGAVFVAMEFIHGATLRDWLRTPRSAAATMDVLLQAGRGLAAAHERGMVHRDFKPDNVMVAEDGRVRVMDFGLVRTAGRPRKSDPEATASPPVGPSLEPADVLDPNGGADAAMARVRAAMASAGKLAAPAASGLESTADGAAVPSAIRTTRPGLTPKVDDLTRTGALLGTPAYMSPEQIHGHAVDARSDQFSFAITAWEALVGQRPFAGQTVLSMTDAIVRGQLEPVPSDVRVPHFVIPALSRALSVERDERFAGMPALLAELGRDPAGRTKAWRRAIAVAAGATVAVAAVVASREEAPCRGGAARVQATWSPQTRASMRAAIAATGVGHAQTTADKVAAQLDDYTTRWAEAHNEACRATAVRAEQSEALLDLRMACLDTRLAEVAALVEILGTADAAIAERATEASARLPPLAPCADRAALTRTVDPPDAAASARIATIRRQLAEASAHRKTGQFDAARDTAAEAMTAAVDVDYRPVRAEAHWVSGLVAADLGNVGQAIEALTAASLHARASGHLQVAAEAQARLAFVVGFSNNDPAAGLLWARHAAAEIDRLGGDRPVRAELANNRGVLLQMAGDSEGALAEFSTALAARQRLLGAEHPDTAESRFNLGVLYRRQGDYTRAREQHEAALGLRETVFGPDHPKVGESLVALGTVLARQGDPVGARTHFERALRLQQATLGEAHLATAGTREALGTLAAIDGEVAEARTHLQAALNVYEASLAPDDARLSRLWMNLGGLEVKAGNAATAVTHYARAAESIERDRGADHPQLGPVLANLGNAQIRQSQIEEAVQTLQRATAILAATEAEPVLRGTALADLSDALAKAGRPGARDAAERAERWLLEAGAAGQVRLQELRHGQSAAPPR